MANPALPQSLRGLVLSAVELRNMTNWPDALIEDYLNILDSLVALSEAINQKNDIIKTVTNVDATMSPYQILNTEEDIFFNTDGGDIEANLPIGVEGRNYRLVNVGSSGNRVNIKPQLTERIFGAASEYMADQEAFILTFDSVEGWN